MSARDFDPAGSPLRVFGGELRYYRAKAGLSQDQLGARASVKLIAEVMETWT